MAIGDVVDFANDWPTSDVTACDHELSQLGLPTLSEVRARVSKLVQRVVRRVLSRAMMSFTPFATPSNSKAQMPRACGHYWKHTNPRAERTTAFERSEL